jgi:FixJ family two-component response regulator
MTDRSFIVVIDGDRSVRKALERLLRTAHMDVETYSSSDKYHLAAGKRQPDCLILNLPFEGITESELSGQLAGMGGSVPVVFTTTANGVEIAHRATGGVEDVLHKPFSDQALLDAIRRAIQGRKSNPDS